jgi:hypothetical protein
MDRHDWSEADDLVAFYLYRFGTERLDERPAPRV